MSTALLVGLKEQQPDAWRRLVQLYGPVVYGWCKRQGLQAQDAEDLVQEVFRTVLCRVGDFRRDRPGDTFRGWLWTITRFKLGDYMRRAAAGPRAAGGTEARLRMEQLPHDEWSGDESAATPGEGSLYKRALDRIRGEFEAATFAAFWAVVAEGRGAADVASDLGLSLNAVYLAKSRVLRRLREELGDAET